MHRLPIKREERSDDELDTATNVALVRRQRQCLMCHGRFSSEWSGERICPKCRGGAAWRQGFEPG
jgi:hypothetical protein